MYDSHILTEHDCRNMWEHGKKYGYGVDITINYYRVFLSAVSRKLLLRWMGNKLTRLT